MMMQMIENACGKILAYNLRYHRNARELTQDEVANSTGIGTRTYHELESGKANPTLQTLELLAQFHGVMVPRLLTLSVIKLEDEESVFLEKVKKTFINENFGFLIRDFDAVARWGNKVIAAIAKHDVTQTPFNLLSIKSEAAQEIIRAQINAERDGIVHPYINTTQSPSGERTYFRIYPTLIYPKKGAKALYSSTYMTPVQKDLEETYYQYCNLLLSCL